MSTTGQTTSEPSLREGTGPSPGGRVYRGRTVAELIPRIQADLGPEAIVLRRRSGLQGGIGGFFQRPFVEIEARGGSGRIDLYDGGVETPMPAFADALAAAGIAITDQRGVSPAQASFEQSALMPRMSAFTTPVRATYEPQAPAPAAPAPAAFEPAAFEPAAPDSVVPDSMAPDSVVPDSVVPDSVVPDPTAPAPTRSALTTKTQQAVSAQLTASGIDERFAQDLIEAAGAHVLSFDPRLGLRKALQIELARRIRCAPALPSSGGAIVLVGPGGSGKTRCAAALAAVYRRTSQKVSCASILSDQKDGSLKMIMSPRITAPVEATSTRSLRALSAARSEGLVLLDTPAISPADPAAIRKLAKLLDAVCPDRVVVTLPATLGPRACSQLLDALRPLKPSALAITHADETDQLGVAVQAACAAGIAPEYLLDGSRRERALSRLDPPALTERLLR